MTTQLELPNDATLPDGWERARVADVCQFIDYGYTASANFTVATPKFLRITDIQNGRVDWEAVPGCEITAEDEEANRLQDGDIVFARTGGTTGKSFLIRQPPRAVFASYLIRLRPSERVTSDFIYAFFQSNDYWQQVNAHARGGAQPNVNATLLGSMTMPLPPVAEQKRIAGILKEQLAAVQRARAAAEAQLEAAKALPAAYLRDVFAGPDEANENRQPIGEVCQLLPSKSIATAGDAEVRAITTACLTESGFDPSGIKTARMWSSDAEDCVVSPNEVLIARSNTTELVGRVAMFSGEPSGTVASDLTIRIWAGERIAPQFLTTYLSFLYVTGYWREKAGGASGSMKKITRSQINSLPIPVPEMDEQRAIVRTISAKMSRVRELEATLRNELQTIEALPASLLRSAFQGQL